MRIRSRIALVGGVPVVVAAIIAVTGWLLLSRSEKVYEAAVLAGSVYRDVLAATAARIDYLQVAPVEREERALSFEIFSEQAGRELERLAGVMRSSDHRPNIDKAVAVLNRYVWLTQDFVAVAKANDVLVADMARHAVALIDLTDRARERQHASNVDLLSSLTEADQRLRDNREVVDRAHEMRGAMLALQRTEAEHVAGLAASGRRPVAPSDFTIEEDRLIRSADRLQTVLQRTDPAADRYKASELARRYTAAVETLQVAVAVLRDARQSGEGTATARERLNAAQRASAEVASVIEALTARILTVKSTGYTAMQDEVVQLLAYSINANDIEQETQNVAVVSLKLGQRAADAVDHRDPAAAAAIITDADALLAAVRALPMAPLLQDEVVAAIGRWRDSLGKTVSGLRRLNVTLAAMDRDADSLTETTRLLDEALRDEAARIGALLTSILMIGATAGLLLAAGAALVVARSIARPVSRLKEQMMRLADDPLAGRIDGTWRRDEFGDMARAAAFFIREIGLREQALRVAKDRADGALEELRRTQADLIQAEKMASLGQLVAGVAHEINTPLGNTLMGASHLSNRLGDMARSAAGGALRRKDFDSFLSGAEELTRLMLLNLGHAAELVQSFKQVAVDQTSGERRRFDLKPYLDDLVTSLKPSWRRAGHTVVIDCPQPITIDGHPGTLARILTNFVMNSIVHGYDDGQSGTLIIAARAPDAETVELVYSDDGRGIDPADLPRIFDPFFTTRRGAGSTGLGLHIVYNLVTASLSGRVAVESALGSGVRFIIRFPRQFITDNLLELTE